MPESDEHHFLVKKIIDWIKNKYGEENCFSIIVDTPGTNELNSRVQINGSFPDVIAKCNSLLSPEVIIGEAETQDCFVNKQYYDHTYLQVKNFLIHCSNNIKNKFIFCVPYHVIDEAEDFIRRIAKKENIDNYNCDIICEIS